MAAEQGQPDSAYNLGVLYASGQGMKSDIRAAARWYRLAAEQGHPDAGFNLAALYATGRGVTQDLVEAYKWFSVAANHGDTDSVKAKQRLAPSMTRAQMETAQASAAAWTPCKTKPECDARVKR